ncbi:MAG: Rdx family protein [Planctomycetota bacterium]
MGAAIEGAFPESSVELKPGGRGDFVVTADGRTIYDKRRQGDRFPSEGEILAALAADG